MSPRGGTRAGAGPKTILDGRTVTSISFDQPTLAKLEYWQRRLGITRSEAVRMIVRETHLPSQIETTEQEEPTNE